MNCFTLSQLNVLLKSQFTMYLSECTQYFKGVIKSIDEGPMKPKLLELGCVPGERFELTNVGRAGDPVAISLGSFKLALRKSEAQTIQVE